MSLAPPSAHRSHALVRDAGGVPDAARSLRSSVAPLATFSPCCEKAKENPSCQERNLLGLRQFFTDNFATTGDSCSALSLRANAPLASPSARVLLGPAALASILLSLFIQQVTLQLPPRGSPGLDLHPRGRLEPNAALSGAQLDAPIAKLPCATAGEIFSPLPVESCSSPLQCIQTLVDPPLCSPPWSHLPLPTALGRLTVSLADVVRLLLLLAGVEPNPGPPAKGGSARGRSSNRSSGWKEVRSGGQNGRRARAPSTSDRQRGQQATRPPSARPPVAQHREGCLDFHRGVCKYKAHLCRFSHIKMTEEEYQRAVVRKEEAKAARERAASAHGRLVEPGGARPTEFFQATLAPPTRVGPTKVLSLTFSEFEKFCEESKRFASDAVLNDRYEGAEEMSLRIVSGELLTKFEALTFAALCCRERSLFAPSYERLYMLQLASPFDDYVKMGPFERCLSCKDCLARGAAMDAHRKHHEDALISRYRASERKEILPTRIRDWELAETAHRGMIEDMRRATEEFFAEANVRTRVMAQEMRTLLDIRKQEEAARARCKKETEKKAAERLVKTANEAVATAQDLKKTAVDAKHKLVTRPPSDEVAKNRAEAASSLSAKCGLRLAPFFDPQTIVPATDDEDDVVPPHVAALVVQRAHEAEGRQVPLRTAATPRRATARKDQVSGRAARMAGAFPPAPDLDDLLLDAVDSGSEPQSRRSSPPPRALYVGSPALSSSEADSLRAEAARDRVTAHREARARQQAEHSARQAQVEAMTAHGARKKAEEELSELKRSQVAFQLQLDAAQSQIAALSNAQATAVATQRQLQDATEKIAALSKAQLDAERLRQHSEEQSRSLSAASTELAQMKQRLVVVETERGLASQKVQVSHAAQQKLAEAEAKIAELERRDRLAETERANAARELDAARHHLAGAQLELQRQQAEARDLSRAREEAVRGRTSVEAQLADERRSAASLQHALEAAKRQAEAQAEQQRQHLIALSEQLAAERATLVSQRQAVSEERLRAEQLTSSLAAREDLVRRLTAARSDIESELLQTVAESQAHTEQLRQRLEAERQALSVSLDQWQTYATKMEATAGQGFSAAQLAGNVLRLSSEEADGRLALFAQAQQAFAQGVESILLAGNKEFVEVHRELDRERLARVELSGQIEDFKDTAQAIAQFLVESGVFRRGKRPRRDDEARCEEVEEDEPLALGEGPHRADSRVEPERSSRLRRGSASRLLQSPFLRERVERLQQQRRSPPPCALMAPTPVLAIAAAPYSQGVRTDGSLEGVELNPGPCMGAPLPSHGRDGRCLFVSSGTGTLTAGGCVETNPGPASRGRKGSKTRRVRPRVPKSDADRGRFKALLVGGRDTTRMKGPDLSIPLLRELDPRLGRPRFPCTCRVGKGSRQDLDSRGGHANGCKFWKRFRDWLNRLLKSKKAKDLPGEKSSGLSTTRGTGKCDCKPNGKGPGRHARNCAVYSNGRGGDDLTADGGVERNPGPPLAEASFEQIEIALVADARQRLHEGGQAPALSQNLQEFISSIRRLPWLSDNDGNEVWDAAVGSLQLARAEVLRNLSSGFGGPTRWLYHVEPVVVELRSRREFKALRRRWEANTPGEGSDDDDVECISSDDGEGLSIAEALEQVPPTPAPPCCPCAPLAEVPQEHTRVLSPSASIGAPIDGSTVAEAHASPECGPALGLHEEVTTPLTETGVGASLTCTPRRGLSNDEAGVAALEAFASAPRIARALLLDATGTGGLIELTPQLVDFIGTVRDTFFLHHARLWTAARRVLRHCAAVDLVEVRDRFRASRDFGEGEALRVFLRPDIFRKAAIRAFWEAALPGEPGPTVPQEGPNAGCPLRTQLPQPSAQQSAREDQTALSEIQGPVITHSRWICCLLARATPGRARVSYDAEVERELGAVVLEEAAAWLLSNQTVQRMLGPHIWDSADHIPAAVQDRILTVDVWSAAPMDRFVRAVVSWLGPRGGNSAGSARSSSAADIPPTVTGSAVECTCARSAVRGRQGNHHRDCALSRARRNISFGQQDDPIPGFLRREHLSVPDPGTPAPAAHSFDEARATGSGAPPLPLSTFREIARVRSKLRPRHDALDSGLISQFSEIMRGLLVYVSAADDRPLRALFMVGPAILSGDPREKTRAKRLRAAKAIVEWKKGFRSELFLSAVDAADRRPQRTGPSSRSSAVGPEGGRAEGSAPDPSSATPRGDEAPWLSELVGERGASYFPTLEGLSAGATPDADALKRCSRAATRQEYQRATRQLRDSSIAPVNGPNTAALQDKHPPLAAPLPPLPAEAAVRPSSVSPEEVRLAIASFPKGAAAGLSGFPPDLLKRLVSRSGEVLLEPLAAFTDRYIGAAGDLPGEARPFLFGATLVALEKPGGGLRPVACGDVFRRIAGKVLSRRVLRHVGPMLLRHRQIAVGVQGGSDAMIGIARRYAACLAEGRVIVKLDLSNAFNNVHRRAIQEALVSWPPEVRSELVGYFLNAYSEASVLMFGDQSILSREGVQQGDPLGPLLFALALARCLERVKSTAVVTAAPPLDFESWYLDDGVIGGPVAAVRAFLDAFTEVGRGDGLILNPAKSELFLAHDGAGADAAWFPELEGVHLVSDLTVLGVPCGASQEAAQLWAAPVIGAAKDKMCWMGAAAEYGRHQAYSLFRFCGHTALITSLVRHTGYMPELDSFDRVSVDSVEQIIGGGLPFEEHTRVQVSLPLREGGLGIRMASSIASAAVVAAAVEGAFLASHLVRSPEVLQDTALFASHRAYPAEVLAADPSFLTSPIRDQLLASLATPVPGESGFDPGSPPPRRTQQRLSRLLDAARAKGLATSLKTLSAASPSVHADVSADAKLQAAVLLSRLIAASKQPGTSGWLTMMPEGPVTEFRMQRLGARRSMWLGGSQFTLCMAFRLGLQIAAGPVHCHACHKAVDDRFGEHSLRCMHGGLRTTISTALCQAIAVVAQMAGYKAVEQDTPFVLDPGARVDVTVSNPAAGSAKFLVDAAITHCHLGNPTGYEAVKFKRYGTIAAVEQQLFGVELNVVPFVVDSVCGIGETGAAFLRMLSSSAAARFGVPKVVMEAQFRQYINCCVMQGVGQLLTRNALLAPIPAAVVREEGPRRSAAASRAAAGRDETVPTASPDSDVPTVVPPLRPPEVSPSATASAPSSSGPPHAAPPGSSEHTAAAFEAEAPCGTRRPAAGNDDDDDDDAAARLPPELAGLASSRAETLRAEMRHFLRQRPGIPGVDVLRGYIDGSRELPAPTWRSGDCHWARNVSAASARRPRSGCPASSSATQQRRHSRGASREGAREAPLPPREGSAATAAPTPTDRPGRPFADAHHQHSNAAATAANVTPVPLPTFVSSATAHSASPSTIHQTPSLEVPVEIEGEEAVPADAHEVPNVWESSRAAAAAAADATASRASSAHAFAVASAGALIPVVADARGDAPADPALAGLFEAARAAGSVPEWRPPMHEFGRRVAAVASVPLGNCDDEDDEAENDVVPRCPPPPPRPPVPAAAPPPPTQRPHQHRQSSLAGEGDRLHASSHTFRCDGESGEAETPLFAFATTSHRSSPIASPPSLAPPTLPDGDASQSRRTQSPPWHGSLTSTEYRREMRHIARDIGYYIPGMDSQSSVGDWGPQTPVGMETFPSGESSATLDRHRELSQPEAPLPPSLQPAPAHSSFARTQQSQSALHLPSRSPLPSPSPSPAIAVAVALAALSQPPSPSSPFASFVSFPPPSHQHSHLHSSGTQQQQQQHFPAPSVLPTVDPPTPPLLSHPALVNSAPALLRAVYTPDEAPTDGDRRSRHAAVAPPPPPASVPMTPAAVPVAAPPSAVSAAAPPAAAAHQLAAAAAGHPPQSFHHLPNDAEDVDSTPLLQPMMPSPLAVPPPDVEGDGGGSPGRGRGRWRPLH